MKLNYVISKQEDKQQLKEKYGCQIAANTKFKSFQLVLSAEFI